MTTRSVQVFVRPGSGLVARAGLGLMVMLDGGAEGVRTDLLDAFERACADNQTPGRMMARRLVGLLSQAEPDDIPAFGACAPNERGWAVILHQGVSVHLVRDQTSSSMSGFEASTWLDRILDDGFDSLTLAAEGEESGPVNTRFHLDGGVIPGAAATLIPSGQGDTASAVPAPAPQPAMQDQPAEAQPQPAAAQTPPQPAAPEAAPEAATGPPTRNPAPASAPQYSPTPTEDPAQQGGPEATAASQDLSSPPAAAAPPPAPVDHDEDEPPTLIQPPDRQADPAVVAGHPEPEDMPAEDVPFESVPLLDIGSESKRDPLPVLSGDTPKEDIEDSDAPLVYGVLSPAGYFNHPDALFCAVTGVGMVHRTHVLVQRPRPPLGVVVADDGSTFTLNSNYVVGREPERDPSVEADEARPLKLQDAERSLSRVHAELRLIDWDVYAVDRGSANGTYVLPKGAGQWKRLVADTPEKIVPGTRVAFGKRVVTYESHHQINQQAAS
ncbi:MAG: FHA domain-containing protein [Euzebya sp.]